MKGLLNAKSKENENAVGKFKNVLYLYVSIRNRIDIACCNTISGIELRINILLGFHLQSSSENCSHCNN